MKPILFSTEMIKALMNGTKTQTRRVAKVPETAYCKQGGLVWYDPEQNQETKRCPRYQPGDILWVRETWAQSNRSMWPDSILYQSGDIWTLYKAGFALYYDRHEVCKLHNEREYPSGKQITWRPSIFMPRAVARIFLRVTGVRAERVQDISEDDARAEGISENEILSLGCTPNDPYRCAYSGLWDSINFKRGYGWDTNPWCWVYDFEQIDEKEAAL